MAKIGIIGSGTWGTALANMLANGGHDVTLYSKWDSSKVKYTLTYMDGTTKVDSKDYNYNNPVNLIPYSKPATKEFTYTFLGWSSNPNAEEHEAGVLAHVRADLTLYAVIRYTASNLSYSNALTQCEDSQCAIDELRDIFNPRPRYAFGTPTTSSTTDYTTLNKNVFVRLQEDKLGVCIIRNGTLECFKNNDVENEQNHVKQVFGESNCSSSSSDVHCNDGAFICDVLSGYNVYCYDYSTYDSCNVSSGGSVLCG